MSDAQRVVLLLSGGPDSATLAYSARSEGYSPIMLRVRQGKNHDQNELRAAKSIADLLECRLEAVDLSDVVDVCGGKIITIHSESAILTYGTAIMLSVSSAYAIQAGASAVMMAIHADDRAEGAEFSREFFDLMEQTIHVATGSDKFRLLTPFLGMTKPEVLKLGAKLGVPFELTWSCIKPRRGRHCGLCGACQARNKALSAIGITDATKYADTTLIGRSLKPVQASAEFSRTNWQSQ